MDASAGVRYVPYNAVYGRRRAKNDLRDLKGARARSATPLSAATVLHDSSQDVGDHVGAGANGKKESSGDEKIFGPYCTQVSLQRLIEFLHWTNFANSRTSWQFSTKVILSRLSPRSHFGTTW